jgi:hypothetical protein
VKQVSIKDVVLSFVLQDLSASLSIVKVFESTKDSPDSIKFTTLERVLNSSLGDIAYIIEATDLKLIKVLVRKIHSDNQALSDLLYSLKTSESEITTVYFFLLSTQKLLDGVSRLMALSI